MHVTLRYKGITLRDSWNGEEKPVSRYRQHWVKAKQHTTEFIGYPQEQLLFFGDANYSDLAVKTAHTARWSVLTNYTGELQEPVLVGSFQSPKVSYIFIHTTVNSDPLLLNTTSIKPEYVFFDSIANRDALLYNTAHIKPEYLCNVSQVQEAALLHGTHRIQPKVLISHAQVASEALLTSTGLPEQNKVAVAAVERRAIALQPLRFTTKGNLLLARFGYHTEYFNQANMESAPYITSRGMDTRSIFADGSVAGHMIQSLGMDARALSRLDEINAAATLISQGVDSRALAKGYQAI